jgi:hypothetical protein
LVVGTQLDHRDAGVVARSVAGLALCTYPNHVGTPKVAGGPAPRILDYRSCPGITKWLAAVRRLKPDYAISPPVGAAHTWEFLRPYCLQANYVCEQEVLVYVTDRSQVGAVQQEGFTVAVLGGMSPAAVPPWSVAPGRVWVLGGSPLEQWRRFAELAFVGCDLRGVIFDCSWMSLAERGLVIGKTPYRLERGAGSVTDMRRESLTNLYEFWRMMDEAYARG